jgi:CAAX protease family protein
MLPNRNEKFERYIAPARSLPASWRLAVGIVLLFVTYQLFVFSLIGVAYLFGGRAGSGYVARAVNGADTPLQTIVVLTTFFGMILALLIVMHLVHRQKLSSLFGGNGRLSLKQMLLAGGIVGAMFIVSTLVYARIYPPVQNIGLRLWLLWLIPALPLLFVQILAEELIFRGYLLQQFAARFQSRWVWWVLPSLIFGSLHYQPATFGDNTWLVVVHTTLFALVASDLTIRTGNLGAAVGLHFANNFFSLLVVGLQGSISGLGLYLSPLSAGDAALRPLLVADLFVLLGAYALYMIIVTGRAGNDCNPAGS